MQAYEYTENIQPKSSPSIVSNLEKLLTQIVEVETTIVQNTPNTRRPLKDSKRRDTNRVNTTGEGCNQTNCCRKLDRLQESDGDSTDNNTKGQCNNCEENSPSNESRCTEKLKNSRKEDVVDDSCNIIEAVSNILSELKQSLRDHGVQIRSDTTLDHIINNY